MLQANRFAAPLPQMASIWLHVGLARALKLASQRPLPRLKTWRLNYTIIASILAVAMYSLRVRARIRSDSYPRMRDPGETLCSAETLCSVETLCSIKPYYAGLYELSLPPTRHYTARQASMTSKSVIPKRQILPRCECMVEWRCCANIHAPHHPF